MATKIKLNETCLGLKDKKWKDTYISCKWKLKETNDMLNDETSH